MDTNTNSNNKLMAKLKLEVYGVAQLLCAVLVVRVTTFDILKIHEEMTITLVYVFSYLQKHYPEIFCFVKYIMFNYHNRSAVYYP